ncbi:hypothetical protein EYF80_030697 [Liparis tanakae]|uniref:Uncharacterized protein n=1 Tax=Liparis tanakae TaxID=230148 RepID=A0A4Z2H1U6_9TELE|nr:hypothetical protein EYF80_030697 [Liparis tanakae]
MKRKRKKSDPEDTLPCEDDRRDVTEFNESRGFEYRSCYSPSSHFLGESRAGSEMGRMNSPMATNTESTRPAARTMKMPPMFSTPRALASLLSSSGQPLPRHHFSFIMCSFPSSCS